MDTTMAQKTFEINIRFDAESKDSAVALAETLAGYLDGRADGWALSVDECRNDTVILWAESGGDEPF
ncbi:uncharacterized protein METZ01_LOCUS216416 [marine metagenome]|uniref:Uncharacterized protein n=1 Tax=marine metagenome TaxID=408172 RepID=A0A382FLS5_9ZZZZ|tara:strand:- start:276 stop:476 length:201 start_codon:yes stop_codon:yes gene_type:complete